MAENLNLKTVETVDTRPFRKLVMTIGELPTSYIESMTYYELLTWFTNYLETTIIPTVNNNAEAVEELQSLFTELKSFVDNYFENLDVQEEINNKLDSMAESGQLQEIIIAYFKNYQVSYEEFGAVGDGVTDDFQAILDAHTYANTNNIPVKAEAGKTYYVKDISETIPIKTDTDWNGSKFIIDDTDESLTNVNLFTVTGNDIGDATLQVTKPLYPYSQSSGITSHGTCICKLVNTGKRDFIRTGGNADSGAYRTEYILVDNDGTILTPLQLEFSDVTECKYKPVENTTLTIKNGEFTTLVNTIDSYSYINRGIEINRSFTRVENLKHTIVGESDTETSSPYNGFIYINFAYDVEINNCFLSAHKTYYVGSTAKGSYDINENAGINIKHNNVTQINSIIDSTLWGIHGSNYCRDARFNNCVLNRIDAHKGITNLSISNSKIGSKRINVVGFGNLSVTNTKVYSTIFVNLRGDYGAFWKGKLELKNCELIGGANQYHHILYAENNQNHDYGFKCYLPNIIINGLKVNTNGSNFTKCSIIGSPSPSATPNFLQTYEENVNNNVYPLIFPESIHLNNIEGDQNTTIVFNNYRDPHNCYFEKAGSCTSSSTANGDNFDKEFNFTLKANNCVFSTYSLATSAYNNNRNSIFGFNNLQGIQENTNTHRGVGLVDLSNCKYLLLSNQGRMISYKVNKCSIYQLNSGYTNNYGAFEIDNCDLHCYYATTPSSSNRCFTISTKTFTITNSSFIIDNSTFATIANIENIYSPRNVQGNHSTPRYISQGNNFNITDEELDNVTTYANYKSRYLWDAYRFKNTENYKTTNNLVGTSSQRPDFNLQIGTTYYDTTNNKLSSYTGSSWT